MSLVSSSIPNFVNGVSQQPYTLRLSSQGELQENGLSTVSSGLRKRPPTEHLVKISSTPLTDAFVHMIDRDGTEQYQVVVTPGTLKVYDLAGNQKTVNFTDAAYLNTTVACTDSFAVTTVADYSFIVNKTKKVANAATLSPTRPYEALINVKLGNYGKEYKVLINGTVVAVYATPDGSNANQSPQLSTDAIAKTLKDRILGGTLTATWHPEVLDGEGVVITAGYYSYTTGAASVYASAPWTVSVSGSVIYIKNTTTDFTVATEDGFSSNAMVAIKGSLQKFTDLPANPLIDSFVVQITGDQSSSFDNYWVKFDAGGNNNVAGTWKETVAPGIAIALDATTMPHILVREVDGTFTFKPATWTNRVCGDLKSNADSSFVGTTINDIFFFQNRLGFLSDENYIMSETGKYFNTYRSTVVTLLDSDPVDVTAATNKVAILKHAVSFNKQLLLFSSQQQFVVDSNELMTPKRVPIKPSTDFNCNTRAKPVAAGRNVYFTMDKGNWSSAREYFVDPNNTTNDAADITSHVPMYVPSGVIKLAAGISEDTVVALSENDRTSLYIYKYYFSGNEKLQSSWSKFTFTGNILNCDFVKSVLYMVISRPEGIFFEKIDFAIGATISDEPYRVQLDRRVQLLTTALTFDGTHTVINATTLGYLPNDGTYMAVSKGGGTIKAGKLYDVIYSGGVTKILGDVTATPLSFGKKYMFTYRVSPLSLRFKVGGVSQTADTEGRTQVRRISFNHDDTGYYQVKVTPKARAAYTYTYSGKMTGAPSGTIGIVTNSSGRLNAPVMSRNNAVDIVVQSDMPLPVAILSADWEADYVKRSQPI